MAGDKPKFMQQEAKYACCFCGKEIKSQGHDVSSILLTTNWNGHKDGQKSQQFFCHFDCFKQLLYDKSFLYIEQI